MMATRLATFFHLRRANRKAEYLLADGVFRKLVRVEMFFPGGAQ